MWIPIFAIYPRKNIPNKKKIKILSYYQIAVDIFVIFGLSASLISLLSGLNFSLILPWCRSGLVRNCSLMTEPSIASIFAVTGLMPNLILKRKFLSLKLNEDICQENFPLIRFTFYSLFILSTSAVAGISGLIFLLILFIYNNTKKLFSNLIILVRDMILKISPKKFISFNLFFLLSLFILYFLRPKRLFSFFVTDIPLIFSILNISEVSDTIKTFDYYREGLTFSSELRLIGPFIAAFQAIKYPFGYDPSNFFNETTFLPIRYFSIGPNGLEIILTYTGYVGFFIFIYLIWKNLKSTRFRLFYFLILFADGSINKPFIGIYYIIFEIISSLIISNNINIINEKKIE